MVCILSKQGLCCIDWCSSECQTWFDSLPKSSLPQKPTEIINREQYSRGSGEVQVAKIPSKLTRAAKGCQQACGEDTGSDSESQIDEEDLRFLKNARIRLEGPKRTSMQYIATRTPHIIAPRHWDSRLVRIQSLLLTSSQFNFIRHIQESISEPGFMPR